MRLLANFGFRKETCALLFYALKIRIIKFHIIKIFYFTKVCSSDSIQTRILRYMRTDAFPKPWDLIGLDQRVGLNALVCDISLPMLWPIWLRVSYVVPRRGIHELYTYIHLQSIWLDRPRQFTALYCRLGRGRLGSLVSFSPRGDARHALFLTAILSGLWHCFFFTISVILYFFFNAYMFSMGVSFLNYFI